MALNVATLVSALASGKQASSADVAVIQNISAQASRDLNLLQMLYSSKDLELARGGYISILDPASGWTQITAQGEGGAS